jgi:HK97 family phage major capsid protein
MVGAFSYAQKGRKGSPKVDYAKLADAALESRKAIVDVAETEARALTADEVVKVDGFEAEARSLIERGEREQAASELRSKVGSLTVHIPTEQKRGAEVQDVNADLRSLARGEMRELSVKTNDAEMRAATVGAATNAGNTIPRAFVPQVIESLREQSPIFSLGKVVTTSSGEPMDWPVKNGHVVPAAVNENTAYSKSDLSTAIVSSTVSKYGVIVEVSRELIDDSAIDIASMVAEDAGTELGRLASTSAMTYLLANATSGGTFAGATAIAADDLLNTYHSLVSGYRRNASWLANDATALYLRKNLKDSQGRYMWQDSTLAGGYADTLLTRPFYTDYNMPTIATGAKSVLFGDFSKFMIRQVGDLRVTRSDEYGFDRDVVAFKVSWRGGFLLTDGAALKSYKQA